MIQILLILIALSATLIGATTGIGGGIVVKVLYDVIGLHSVLEIGFYTTVLVFTMSIISIYKQYRNGFNYDLNILLSISLGSILGGYLGDWLLNYFASDIPKNQLQIGQSTILLFTLIFLLFYTQKKKKNSIELKRSRFNMFLLGLFLGSISIFLGIGGGPLNVSLLVIFFNYSMKQASVYSIATVFFSQITKVFTIIASQQYTQFDLSLIPWLILVGVVGGYYGTKINQRITNESIGKVYNIFMLGMCAITIYNILRFV